MLDTPGDHEGQVRYYDGFEEPLYLFLGFSSPGFQANAALYLQHTYRKRIETTISVIEQMLPKTIHAVTARGFELKVFLFVLAFSIDGLL